MYNLSFMDTNSTLVDMFIGVNTETTGLLAGILLFAFFLLLMIGMKNYYTKIAILAASFITTIVGILLVFLGVTSFSVVMFFIIGTVGSTIYYYFSEE